MKKKVVVKDGRSRNLYSVEEFSGVFVVYHVKGGFLLKNETRVGKARTFEDAIVLVKVHAGANKIEIGPW